MHPTDKKNAVYLGLLFMILSPVLLFFWIKSLFFVMISIFVLLIIDKYTEKLIHALILALVLSTIGFVSFFLAEQVLLLMSHWNSYLLAFSIIFSVVVPALLFMKIHVGFVRIIEASTDEKNSYYAIKRHPYLVCAEHHTRTIFKKQLGYKKVTCRVQDNCFAKKKLVYAKEITGVLGNIIANRNSNGNFYLELWNEQEERINNADYDIIEIYENKEIANYDSIIANVTGFLYNEIHRYKPVNEIIVKIIGNPDISESSMRLLKERFKKVEYIAA